MFPWCSLFSYCDCYRSCLKFFRFCSKLILNIMKTGLFNFSGFGRRISTGLRGIVAAFHAVSARMTLALVSMALIGGMASCTFDDTDLQNSIDDLTSRVEALEDFQEQVQGDIASLQDIISKLDSWITAMAAGPSTSRTAHQ